MADMTIDELAQRAGTTSRNVRAYQERGLLPPPERKGRVGVYSEGHLARLRLVAELAGRGFSLASIGELIEAWEAGNTISDVLGFEHAVTAWGQQDPVVLTAAELVERFGGVDPAALQRSIDLGLVEPADGGFRVLAPQLLDVGADLVALGVPIDAVLDESAALLDAVDTIAGRFVALFTEHVVDVSGATEASAEELRAMTEKVTAARPLASRAVERALTDAMARHVAGLVGAMVSERETRSTA